MQAILCTRPGGPDDLVLTDLPEPVAGPGEAVVRVAAAALNFFDLLIIADKYQVKPPKPFSPAAEFAGIVESVGAGVTVVKPGDRVAAHIGFGAAREKVAVAAERLVRVPDGLDLDRAAGVIITYGTSLHGLRNCAQLRPGETLAVLGASGGVGLAAVELGKQMGARVIACASSADKLAFARAHGADEVINYASEDLKDGLRRLTNGAGVDVVYDPIGGEFSEKAVRGLAWRGRLLVVGFAAGTIPKLPLNLVLLKEAEIKGVHWGAWVKHDPAGQRANLAEIMDWCAAGKLSAHVHVSYPLAQTASALKALADRQAMGKVILKP